MIRQVIISLTISTATCLNGSQVVRIGHYLDRYLIDAVLNANTTAVLSLFNEEEKPDVNAIHEWEYNHWYSWTFPPRFTTIDAKEPIFLTAVKKGFVDIVKIFLDNNVDVNNLVDGDQNTALMIAILAYNHRDSSGYPYNEMLSLLLSCPRIDVNRQDHFKTTPIETAAVNGHADVVEKLLVAGSFIHTKGDQERALRNSVTGTNRNPAVSAQLIYAGADPDFVDAAQKNFYSYVRDVTYHPHFIVHVQKELDALKKQVAAVLVSDIKEVDFPRELTAIVADYAIPSVRVEVAESTSVGR